MGRVKWNSGSGLQGKAEFATEEKLEILLRRIYETSQQLVPVSVDRREGPFMTKAQEKRLQFKHRRGSRNARHKPGTLKRSGRYEILEGGLEGRVIYTAPYAYYVEKGLGPGTRKAAYFLARALDAHAEEVKDLNKVEG